MTTENLSALMYRTADSHVRADEAVHDPVQLNPLRGVPLDEVGRPRLNFHSSWKQHCGRGVVMKTTACAWARWAAALIFFFARAFLLASPEDQPVITSVRLEGTNLVVTARVPEGTKRLTLECRNRLGSGSWVPRSVARLQASSAEVTLRIPRAAQLEVLRVRADDREPLPDAFYGGTNAFSGQPVGAGGLGPVFEGPADSRGGDPAAGAPSRDVVESDIWKIRGDTLYFFNQYRGLQIIDISNPDAASVKGTLALPATGDQMYLLADDYVVLLAHDGCGWSASGPESQALIVSGKNNSPEVIGKLPVNGYMQESRLVGSALYIASQAYRPLGGSNGWESGILVTGFDLSDPKNPVARNTLWYSGYANAVAANDAFLFVASPVFNNWWQSVVHCIDITAPDGALRDYASLGTAGQVRDKFKLNWNGNTFTALSQAAASGRLMTKLETFHLPHPLSAGPEGVVKLGELELGVGEQLFGTRFDGERAYVVTFFTRTGIDPLWIVDLSDAAHPRITGELVVPGFSTYLQPLGDRLVAIGTETNRTTVSLFDVADATRPALLSRVSLGDRFSWSEANFDEKAFNVMPDAGLILVPFSGSSADHYIQAVQLVDLKRDWLQARGVIEHEFQPRRATVHRDRVVSISGLQLLSVDASDRDHPVVKEELGLAWPVDRLFVVGDHLPELTTGPDGSWRGWWGDQSGPSLRVALASDPDKVVNEVGLM